MPSLTVTWLGKLLFMQRLLFLIFFFISPHHKNSIFTQLLASQLPDKDFIVGSRMTLADIDFLAYCDTFRSYCPVFWAMDAKSEQFQARLLCENEALAKWFKERPKTTF